MACPMRVVYASAAATILMLLVMFDMWRNGQPDLDGLGDMEIEPQPGVWERLKATLDPRYLWARLWDNSGPVWERVVKWLVFGEFCCSHREELRSIFASICAEAATDVPLHAQHFSCSCTWSSC